jgi:hypothetical protein
MVVAENERYVSGRSVCKGIAPLLVEMMGIHFRDQ